MLPTKRPFIIATTCFFFIWFFFFLFIYFLFFRCAIIIYVVRPCLAFMRCLNRKLQLHILSADNSFTAAWKMLNVLLYLFPPFALQQIIRFADTSAPLLRWLTHTSQQPDAEICCRAFPLLPQWVRELVREQQRERAGARERCVCAVCNSCATVALTTHCLFAHIPLWRLACCRSTLPRKHATYQACFCIFQHFDVFMLATFATSTILFQLC